MIRWLAALLVVLCVGCDDETIQEMFVPYFLCSYLPMWMGDCQDQAVIDKAQSVLVHGLVDAEVDCECGNEDITYVSPNNSGTCPGFTYRGQKLIDGSCYTAYSRLLSRGQPGAENCSLLPGQPGNLYAENGFVYRENPVGTVACYAPIETCCTGFHLEAFGVE